MGYSDNYTSNRNQVNRNQVNRNHSRKKRRIPGIAAVLLIAAGVGIIIYAIIYESRLKAEPDEETSPKATFNSRDPVQSKINGLDWIIPMPLTINDYSRPGTRIKKVNGIVIHYIGNPGTTAEENRNFYENLAVYQTTSVSSNFLIDMDGTIIQCIPVDEVAYASNHRNDDTISIEVCHPDETGEFTNASYNSIIKLTAWLCNEFGLTINEVYRHYDITGKECPRYYVENQAAWEALKEDINAQME